MLSPRDFRSGTAPACRQRPRGDRTPPERDGITGVILAGGMGRRLGGQDKGLIEIDGRPLIAHVIDALRPQVSTLFISANRNLDRYRSFGHRVMKDAVAAHCGPLGGIATAMQCVTTPFLLTVPCDAPLVPADLCCRLSQTLHSQAADVSMVYDGHRIQPLFALLRRELLMHLIAYLDQGERKVSAWFNQHDFALADLSDQALSFLNLNTPEDVQDLAKRLRQNHNVIT
jgi:molybdopterin-guanine dinucleotide biosynthesis protein A